MKAFGTTVLGLLLSSGYAHAQECSGEFYGEMTATGQRVDTDLCAAVITDGNMASIQDVMPPDGYWINEMDGLTTVAAVADDGTKWLFLLESPYEDSLLSKAVKGVGAAVRDWAIGKGMDKAVEKAGETTIHHPRHPTGSCKGDCHMGSYHRDHMEARERPDIWAGPDRMNPNIATFPHGFE